MQHSNRIFDDLQTLNDFIRWSMSQMNHAGIYFGHETENAFDEALALVLHACHCDYTINAHLLNARCTLEEKQRIVELLTQRIEQRLPLPYLTHQAHFGGHTFYVDQRVIIPRSPIAELLLQQLQPWVNPDKVHNMLDLCCGSGCIGIVSHYHFPQAHIDMVDISDDAVAVAEKNIAQHQCEHAVNVIKSDVFSALEAKQQYQVIISNPPYVDAEDIASMPEEYRKEPQLALAAGDDGLDIVRIILSEASDYLSEDGILIVEVGNSWVALEEQYPDVPFTWLEFERGGHGVFLLTKEQLSPTSS